MGNDQAPFLDIGRRAKGLSTKDYNFDHKFTFSVPSATGMGLAATSVKKGDIFVGDIITPYKGGSTTVDVKVDSYSNLDLLYLHDHAAINSSIGLDPTPQLEVAATLGSKDLALGGEISFNSATASFTKYNAGISIDKPDFSAALILAYMGQTVKASYVPTVNSSTCTEVAAEMIHRLSSFDNSFTIGSSHGINPFTTIKTRFTNNGKVGVLCQQEWRPHSLITFSAVYDSKATSASPKLGLTLALKP